MNMKLSTKSRYGLRALIDIAKSYGTTPAKRSLVAKNQGISDSYLENILILLKNNRILETERGINGGYMLCRPPGEITILEIINTLEGPLDLVDCLSDGAACKKVESCTARTIWKELSDSWKATLGNLTLQDLIEREDNAFIPMYSI